MPFELGGGPSSTEQNYNALKQAVGEGGSAEYGTIEAAWRLAKSQGLRAAQVDDRAFYQNFPHTASDYIEVFEDLLGLNPGALCEQERRDQIKDRYVLQIDAAAPGLEDDLQEITTSVSLVDTDRDTAVRTINGRGFEDYDPTDADACAPEFGGSRTSTQYPNYSSDFVCVVYYNTGAGSLSGAQKIIIERLKKVLNESLPAWVDFSLTNQTAGFILDQDLLDIGSFGP